MKNNLLKHLFSLLFICLAVSATAQTEERMYVKDLTVEPGGETQYMLIALENGSDETYTAFQVDVELPKGLELSYYNGEAEVYLPLEDHVYPADRRGNPLHTVAYKVEGNLIKIRCYSSTNQLFTSMNGNLLEIGVVPSAYLKPGDVEIKLHGVLFANVTEQAGYNADLITSTAVQASSTSTLNLNVSATNKFSTAVLPFDVAEIPAGLEVYSCGSTSGENLVLSRQQSIKAFTPYILYAANGYNGTLSGTVDASKYAETVTEGYLTGTLINREIAGGKGYYVMQNKGEGPMFYRVEDTAFAIPAGKCWLTIPAGMQSAVSFHLDGTTGIGELKGEEGNAGTIYDVQGRSVKRAEKGLYIINGEKVLKK